MAAAQDILEDENGDLLIVGKDLVIGFSDKQHIKDIIQSNIGYWKQYPLVGVGVHYYLNSSGLQQQLERKIRIQLIADGYSLQNPRVKNLPDGTLDIQPNAERL